jgi:hypothetical protein
MLGAVGIVMIGLVALAAFFMSLLDFFGFAPADQGPANDVAGVGAEAPALAEVEISSEEAAALTRAVDARLADLGAALDARASGLESEIEAVRGQVAALGETDATAAPASAAPAPVDVSGLETEIAELRALVDGLRAADEPAPAAAAEVRELRADVADLQARLASLGVSDATAAGGPAVAYPDLDSDPIAALSQQISRLDRRVSEFNNTVVADLAQKVGRLDAAAPAVESFQIRTADGVMTCRASGGGAETEYFCTPAARD